MKKRLLIILGIALAVRVLLILVLKTYAHPVAWEYEVIVNNILHGNGFLYDNFLGTPYRSLTTPLYVYLCVGVYSLTGHSWFAILLIQSIFSMCLAAVIFKIAGHMFGEKVALISAILVAFHPGFVYYDVFNLVPFGLDSLIIAGSAWLMMRLKDRPSLMGMSCLGFVIGLGALTRGIIGALLPFLSVYFILFTKHKLSAKVRYIVTIWVAAFIVISPWVARNYSIHKEFVFISSTSGENLYRGNNLTAPGTSLTADGRSVSDLWPKEVRDKIAVLDEMGQKKFFEREAISFIRNNPKAFIKLYLKKIYYFWWFSPQSGGIYPKYYLGIYKMFYGPILFLAIIGLALSLTCDSKTVRDGAWLVIFVFMTVCLTQSLFYVEGRHRWLIEPLLIIFSCYGAAEICKLLIGKTRSVFAGHRV